MTIVTKPYVSLVVAKMVVIVIYLANARVVLGTLARFVISVKTRHGLSVLILISNDDDNSSDNNIIVIIIKIIMIVIELRFRNNSNNNNYNV